MKIDKENSELRKIEHNLKSDIEKMNSSFENEVSKYFHEMYISYVNLIFNSYTPLLPNFIFYFYNLNLLIVLMK